MKSMMPTTPGHDTSQQAERDRQARAARVAGLNHILLDRSREIKRHMSEQASQRLRVAENLWSIIEAAQRQSPTVTRAAVLHSAQMGRVAESTKRAEYYLCDPRLPPEEKARRATKLTRDPQGYVRLARATAALLHRDDTDAFLLDLFAGTRFAAEVESDLPLEDPQREAWATLLMGIQRRATAISDEFALPSYFVRQRGWGFRYENGRFLTGGREAEEPTAFLGWVDAGWRRGLFSFRILDPRDLYGADCTPDDVATYEELVSAKADEVPVDVHTVLALHLVLAPQAAGGTVVPCLRARCLTYITVAQHWNLLQPYTGKPLQRGEVIATCDRALATRKARPVNSLPHSLNPSALAAGQPQQASLRDFEIGEHELTTFSVEALRSYGFDMGMVTLADAQPKVPPSLCSDEESDSPRVILPLGEEALSLLELPISSFMMELDWERSASSSLPASQRTAFTSLPYPIVRDWLNAMRLGGNRLSGLRPIRRRSRPAQCSRRWTGLANLRSKRTPLSISSAVRHETWQQPWRQQSPKLKPHATRTYASHCRLRYAAAVRCERRQ